MSKGIKNKTLGKILAVLFCIAVFIGPGFLLPAMQTQTAATAVKGAFGIPFVVVGIGMVIIVGIVTMGGIKRIGQVAEFLAPIMCGIYLLVMVIIMIVNAERIPSVFGSIFASAFGKDAVFGGIVGSALSWGIKRGFFSNDAGNGMSPLISATTDTSHPVKQGLIQALGVFTDTLVVCSCTAFIILVSGVDLTASNGIQLTQDALTHEIGSIGNPFVAVMIWLFAFSSIIGNYYYGETNVRYIRDSKLGVFVYRLAVAAMVMVGAVVSLDFAWSFADITMALLTLCNLVAIVLLSRQAVFLLKDYRQQKKEGKNPVFTKDKMPEISDKLEAW